MTAITRTHLAAVALALSTLGVACASDPAPSASAPTSTGAPTPAATRTAPATAPDACSEIAGACHMHDKNEGAATIHECHELGHAHKLEACVARRQECLAACDVHAH